MGRLGSERGHSNRFGQNSKRRRYRAFTLIELLVVLATIGLLAALILPSLSRAKTQGFSTICRNHLRQIGFAAQMYLADYRHYPTFWGMPIIPISPTGAQLPDDASLARYLSGEGKVFNCPVQERTPLGYWSGPPGGYALNAHGTDSGPQYLQLSEPLGLLQGGWGIKEAKVCCPADMIAYGDTVTGGGSLSPTATNRFGGMTARSLPSSRHLGGANLLFCEGHVEYQKQARWIMATDTARRRWNNDHEPHLETW